MNYPLFIDQHARQGFLKAGAQQFTFTWGYILERRANQYVVWDFCLEPLLKQYLAAGKPLEDCQHQVFKALEQRFQCTTRDLLILVGLTQDWQLCPAPSIGLFSQVSHFTAEKRAREWISGELLTALPDIIQEVQNNVLRNTPC